MKMAHPNSLEASQSCHLCDRKFTLRKTLERHMIENHGDKSIPCHLCKKKFNIHKNLKRHLERKHKIEIPTDTHFEVYLQHLYDNKPLLQS